MKTKQKLSLALIACLLGGVAWAATFSIDLVQRWMKAGFYVGTAATASSTNAITNSATCTLDYVFPAQENDAGAGVTGFTCFNSVKNATCNGTVTYGDPMVLGHRSPQVTINSGKDDVFTCYASATGTVKVRRCSAAGEAALPDAGFDCRSISRQ